MASCLENQEVTKEKTENTQSQEVEKTTNHTDRNAADLPASALPLDGSSVVLDNDTSPVATSPHKVDSDGPPVVLDNDTSPAATPPHNVDSDGAESYNSEGSSEAYSEDWSRPWRQPSDKKANSADSAVKPKRQKLLRMKRQWSDRDTEDYRAGYPGKKDNPRSKDNLMFYRNEISSYPSGDTIDNIHKKWWGNYDLLEDHHGYIQWMFPLRESGMNWHAKELQLHEAKAIQQDPIAHKRVLTSYIMMLDFYGIKLQDEETGLLERAKNWRERFKHLNRSMHNYLRITRILKSLGELGYEYLKAPFVKFILIEALVMKTLPNCLSSCVNYWIHVLKSDEERNALMDYAEKHMDS